MEIGGDAKGVAGEMKNRQEEERDVESSDSEVAGAPLMSRDNTQTIQRLEDELRDMKEQLAFVTKALVTRRRGKAKQQKRESVGDIKAHSYEESISLQDASSHDSSSDTFRVWQSSSDEEYEDLDLGRQRMIRGLQRKLDRLTREDEMISRLKRDRRRFLLLDPARQPEKGKTEERELSRHESGGRERDMAGVSLFDRPVHPTPRIPHLSRVDWDTFNAVRIRGEDDPCVIDVLIGEPVFIRKSLNDGGGSRRIYRHGRDRETLGKHEPTVTRTQFEMPGDGPLPERIRIHSKYILRILETIHGNPLSDRDGPVVMIRPFRALTYYQDKIRRKLHELERRFSTWRYDESRSFGGNEDKSATESNDDNQGHGDGEDELTSSEMALQHLKCLVGFIDTEIADKLNYLASGRCESVAFADIWYLFNPGDEVIENTGRQAYRVLHVTGGNHQAISSKHSSESYVESTQNTVCLICVHLDFDGARVGPIITRFNIEQFDGQRAITSLDVYPLRFAEREKDSVQVKGSFREKFIARGKMFLEVAGVKHVYYNGLTLETRDQVDSQVVVDFEGAFSSKNNKDWRPTLGQLTNLSTTEAKDEIPCHETCCAGENIHSDAYVEKKRNDDYIARLIPKDQNKEPSVAIYPRYLQDMESPENPLTDDDLVIMAYRVFGFILRSRKWAKLDLANLFLISPTSRKEAISEEGKEKITTEQETILDQLVIPQGHKAMLLSLLAQHFRDKESVAAMTEQADIVRGKGKGLIILLHGGPGVGKTATAGQNFSLALFSSIFEQFNDHSVTEVLAECFQRPLFTITSGDLGTTVSEVEVALETHFALATRWGCILLLDEADVFLASRTPQDFERSGLLSVFLRVLDDYAGILFLTTNQMGDFDEAFASRIHISLYYPPLDLCATQKLLKMNLRLIHDQLSKKQRKIDIEEEQILEFATQSYCEHMNARWNGRQIRNACQTALALAEFEAQHSSHEKVPTFNARVVLTLKNFEVVFNAHLEFISFLETLYDVNSGRRAK